MQNTRVIETQLQIVRNVTLTQKKGSSLKENGYIQTLFVLVDLYNYVLCVGTLLPIFQLSGM